MKRALFIATTVATVLVLILSLASCDVLTSVCPHVWKDATCVDPKECTICGATEGEPNGHSGESTCTSAKCDICGETYEATGEHSWIEATCNAPKTCSICGTTDGELADHNYAIVCVGDGTHKFVCSNDPTHEGTEDCYGGEATCLAAAACDVCGASYGSIGTHSWLEPTCTEPETCKWCALPDGEPKGHSYDYSTGKCVDCDDTVSIVLYTLTPTCVVESSSQKVIFYAEIVIDETVTSVELYDSLGNKRATMYDDGNYGSNNDEFSNDGVYTCPISINTDSEREIGFYVVLNGNNEALSNVLSIKWVDQMTSAELDNMQYVEEQIENIASSVDFASLNESEKIEVIEQTISVLENSALIADNSVVFDSTNGAFTFVYESGVLGAISIEEWAETEAEYVFNGDGMNDVFTDVDAVILWSFNQYCDSPSFRVPFYNDLYSYWNGKGIETNLDMEVTVADYKNLSSYEIILISAHGAYYRYKVGNTRTAMIPGIILSEEVTREKDELYANDLKMQRIAKYTCLGGAAGTKYVILPAFWEYYYGGGALDGSFVISESCEFYGAYGDKNYSMANAIIKCSAEGVLGYHNSVEAVYSRVFATSFIECLISGMRANDAYHLCAEALGYDDGQFFAAAYPIYTGADAYLISSDLENGSFEATPNLDGWSVEGDVRILSQLGELDPTDEGKMAILTTGVGSGTSGYVEATEGSVLYQTFFVNYGNTILSFDYNVVSEEPMEYVGSQYDDKMYAEIIAQDGTKSTICAESVNASTWVSVSGINFEGGDSTCYETGWRTIEVDMSQYQGQFVTIRFVVYDVGDSAYDTAALIDNVVLQ